MIIREKVTRAKRPDFFVPVDNTNDIVTRNNLVGAWFPISGSNLFNAVNGDLATNQDTTIVSPSFNAGGRYYSYAGPQFSPGAGHLIGDVDYLQIADELTVIQRIKCRSTAGGNAWGRTITKQSGGGDGNWDVAVDPSSRELYFTTHSSDYVISSFGLVAEQYYDVAIRYKSGTKELIIDGVVDSSNTITGNLATSGDVVIGNYKLSSNSGFNGDIDYTIIFHGFVSLDDINSIHKNQQQILEPSYTDIPLVVSAPALSPIVKAIEVDTTLGFTATKQLAIAKATTVAITQAFTAAKRLAIAKAIESDTTIGFSTSKSLAITKSVELDTTIGFTASKILPISKALELDIAYAFNTSKNLAITKAIELDQTLGFIAQSSLSITKAIEVDSAFGFIASKVLSISKASTLATTKGFTFSSGLQIQKAIEVDSTLGFTTSKSLSISKAVTLDSTIGFTFTSGLQISRAIEVNSTLAFAASKALPMQKAVSLSTTLGFTFSKNLAISKSIENSTTKAFAVSKVLAIAKAIELDITLSFPYDFSIPISKAIEIDTTKGFLIGGTSWDTATLTYMASEESYLTFIEEASALTISLG